MPAGRRRGIASTRDELSAPGYTSHQTASNAGFGPRSGRPTSNASARDGAASADRFSSLRQSSRFRCARARGAAHAGAHPRISSRREYEQVGRPALLSPCAATSLELGVAAKQEHRREPTENDRDIPDPHHAAGLRAIARLAITPSRSPGCSESPALSRICSHRGLRSRDPEPLGTVFGRFTARVRDAAGRSPCLLTAHRRARAVEHGFRSVEVKVADELARCRSIASASSSNARARSNGEQIGPQRRLSIAERGQCLRQDRL